MSTRFTIFCVDHEVPGPHIRRHHSGALLMAEGTARFFPTHDEDQASSDWGSFLIEHEYCELRLEYERTRRLVGEAQARERQREWEEATKPTHRLLPDGNLEAL